jgi:hypothetical protein
MTKNLTNCLGEIYVYLAIPLSNNQMELVVSKLREEEGITTLDHLKMLEEKSWKAVTVDDLKNLLSVFNRSGQ